LEQNNDIPFTRANFNALIALVAELKDEIVSLKYQLKKDSHNSSKPLGKSLLKSAFKSEKYSIL